ncbi:MAG: ribosome-associated translation inhibitor RaiA [Candidatus Campbellbacteria bacterium]|nr:ribosome-associated translation inhibitor RaiA [Candidatus Campbellbacteria bacterium]
MLNISLKATGMELTSAIRSYAQEKVVSVGKFIDPSKEAYAEVEMGMTTRHHSGGSIFRCEINLRVEGELIRVVSDKEDLYAAIDVAKDELLDEVRKRKNKKTRDSRRGARMFKSLLQKMGLGGGDEN